MSPRPAVHPAARLAIAAAALIAGEAAGFAMSPAACAWKAAALVAAVAMLAAWGWGARGLAPVAAFLAGALLALRTEERLQRLLDENAGVYGPRRSLSLVVEGTASEPRRMKDGSLRLEFFSSFGPVPLKVVMPTKEGAAPPGVGEVWEVEGQLSCGHDAERRYRRRTLWVPTAECARRAGTSWLGRTRAAWEMFGDELALRAGAGLDWDAELASLNRAILLGRRAELPKERRRTFADAGTIHVFAISGLHVMVVAWLLNSALCRMEVSERVRGLAGIPLIAAYVALTGARPSAVRAAMMCAFMQSAPAFGRRPNALAAWAATALLVYGASPERLFDLGCTLSFTVMLGIVFWLGWARRFEPWFAPGSRAAEMAGGMGVALAAWVAGAPIAAHAFGRFTPGGLLANLAVVVCAKYMVRAGLGALAASFVCMPLAALLNNAAAALTWAMEFVSVCVASLPGASFSVAPWTFSACAVWYGGWALALFLIGRVLPRRSQVSRRWW